MYFSTHATPCRGRPHACEQERQSLFRGPARALVHARITPRGTASLEAIASHPVRGRGRRDQARSERQRVTNKTETEQIVGARSPSSQIIVHSKVCDSKSRTDCERHSCQYRVQRKYALVRNSLPRPICTFPRPVCLYNY